MSSPESNVIPVDFSERQCPTDTEPPISIANILPFPQERMALETDRSLPEVLKNLLTRDVIKPFLPEERTQELLPMVIDLALAEYHDLSEHEAPLNENEIRLIVLNAINLTLAEHCILPTR